jgi:hypothetical protein
MKRYRVLSFDFDSRATNLEPIPDHWKENVKKLRIENREKTILGLKYQYGEQNSELKIANFVDLKSKPFSISAFHNKFLEQARNAYVIGSYYPALTGVCALGERILNRMIILLRNYHKDSPEYRKVYRKDSFDNWALAIDTLESWNELLPEAVYKFRELHGKRNKAIHFNPETDHNDKELALEAIHLMQDIVSIQFSSFGTQPWVFCVPGEIYIKKEWEHIPFVKEIFIPNCVLVGPKHRIETLFPKIIVNDQFEYENKEITDEEFYSLRENKG